MDDQALFSLFLGFFIIVTIVGVIKMIRSYYVYKASFYPEIYSGFFEFFIRKGNLKRMSQSYWLENELGEHRIIFQVTKTSQKDILQPYILILLTSGLYIIQVHNKSSHYIYHKEHFKSVDEKQNVQNLPNPISEVSTFQKHFLELIDYDIPIFPLIVFPNDSQLSIECQEVPFIKKDQLFETLKHFHQNNQSQISSKNIDNVYMKFMKKDFSK